MVQQAPDWIYSAVTKLGQIVYLINTDKVQKSMQNDGL